MITDLNKTYDLKDNCICKYIQYLLAKQFLFSPGFEHKR
jgi:hypothetical protein